MWFGAVFYFALFSPVILLAVLWHRLLSGQRGKFGVVVAVLASLSYGYLVAALLFRSRLLGSDYGGRLFITVETNTAVAFCLAILAGTRKSPVRVLLACSAFIISACWFLLWVINAAV
jgi:hypothetical protein